MDEKTYFKQILKDISIADLNGAIRFMKSLTPETSNNKQQINVIITLCQLITNSKLKDKIPLTDLINLIILCCSKITCPNESDINNYLRSLYFLIKYLANKMEISELMPVCEYIFPDWISTKEVTKDIYDLIVHFTVLLHNDFIMLSTKTDDINSLVKYFWLHLRLFKYIFHKQPATLFSKINIYCTLLYRNYQFKDYSKFCLDVSGLLSDIKKLPDRETVESAYESFLCIIYIYYAKSPKDFNKSGPEVEKFFKIMDKLCKFDSEHILCMEIFKLFYELTVRKLDEYKSYDVILFKNVRENSEKLLKTYSESNSAEVTFCYMSRLVTCLIADLEKSEKENWLTFMKIEIQIEYIKIFNIISQVISKTDYKDKCSKNCTIVTDITHAYSLNSISGTFLNLSLQYETPNVEELHETVISSLTNGCKYIEELKIGNCNRWRTNWKIIGPIIYNIGSRFYRFGNSKLSKTYFLFLCKYVILFEGVKNEMSFIENLLGSCLNTIGYCYLELKQYRSALTYIGFAIHVCPPLQNKNWQVWCNIKSKANSENVGNIAELTLNYILESDEGIIQRLHPAYNFEGENVDLLLSELKAYEKIWPSKIPMKNACKELLSICKDPLTCTKALNITWEKILSLQDKEFVENVERIIVVVSKKDKKNSLTNQVCLSVLHYINFQCKNYEVLKKNLSEMNEAAREEKPILKPSEEPINPNDKCDVIPTYYNNKIENNMNLQKILHKAVDLWNKILENKQLNTVKDLIQELHIDKAIEQTAYEFRLNNYSFQALKIWFLYLQYGKLFNKKDIIVKSTGFILESIDCNTKTAIDLEEFAENYVKEFIKSNDPILIENVVAYYINKSLGYLNANILKSGYKELCNAEIYLNSLKEPNKLLEARIMHIKSLYNQKSCNMNLTDHKENYIAFLQNSFAMIADFYKFGGSKCLYTLSILFDISLSIGHLYKWLRMPREIRAYTSESVLLAQQMVLPLRTVEFFSLLAFTDLLGCQFDDCKVKLSGIDYILCCRSTSKFTKSVIEQIDQDKILEVSKEFEHLSLTRNDHLIESMLDVPMDHRMKNNQGSPILESRPFKIPPFIYHVDCNCFYCINVDYQRLVLEAIHLEALFSCSQNNANSSTNYFQGGLGLFKSFLRKYESHDKNLGEDLLKQFKKKLNFTYSQFLMDFSFFYAKQRDYNQALKVVDKVFEYLGDDVQSNAYFYSEILMHKINLITAIEFKDIKPKKIDTSNELTVDYNIFSSKTPENKISISKISVSVSPCKDNLPKNHAKQFITFDIFASDEETDKSPEVKNKIFKLKSPGKTPAPYFSKLKISTPSKASRQNKVQPIYVSKPNTTKKESSTSVETESKVKSRKILEKRTKLLTEKLKTEKKTVLKESNRVKNVPVEPKNVPNNQKENITTRKLHKNLIDDIIDSEKDYKENKTNTKSRVRGTWDEKETEKPVKKVGKKQYKRIVIHSNSSDESSGRVTSRSRSKI